jgi:formylmethanofuran dehydrogenase subunit D
VNRSLLKIEMSRETIDPARITKKAEELSQKMNITKEEASYFVISDQVYNRAYNVKTDVIKIKMKDGSIVDAAKASDHLNLQALSESVQKYFLAYHR